MSKLYLAYGSNLNLQQMAYRCPTARVVATTYLEHYKLTFRGHNGNAVATVEPSENDRVPVMIWEIFDKDEESLDIYEGYPRLYRKEYVTVKINNRKTQVMMYVMNPGRPLGKPSAYYYSTILQGYLDARFDKTYLNNGVKRSVAK
ncbi:MAG: gamma-glutamylcyclotransferase [Clostridia bacterium]|nr:gamma-glutamylcyclotransferase [Clostridia bacterium]